MKKFILYLILIAAFSCQGKKDVVDNGEDLDDTFIQEIGKIYYPEKIDTRSKKVEHRNEKKDYIIDITNCDSLKENSTNLTLNSKNIAYLYKKHLINNHRIPNNIIVNIKRTDGNNQSFEFDEKELMKLEITKEKSE
ncbi:hypothetical protein SGQ44_01365 [Flavobacterium sp. Fl-77]|uniref:Lipoprotein n=1 Tax=Flavobacterium flavipigmentatum TaxID=2893884 RepID=A0AAJ2S8C2_9FLAO|nr:MULTISPECIES: hypothetical protein [unclassified Flavobacterium]MDX6180784.1 hypothetical protein [Flavobacterium sp. Fl-33]MDX6184384.1 hypothetical protein [Flavobacterium sp. Fl-77]UFH39493.1 hypothetical protein LNP22_04260 [Flavobacterium sp. F-70]